GGCSLRRNWSQRICWFFLLLGSGCVASLNAEDVDCYRPNLRSHGDCDSNARADDFQSFGFGVSGNVHVRPERTLECCARNFTLESIVTHVRAEARTGLEYVIGDSVGSAAEAEKSWIDDSSIERSETINTSAVFPLGLRAYLNENELHPSADPDGDVSHRFF